MIMMYIRCALHAPQCLKKNLGALIQCIHIIIAKSEYNRGGIESILVLSVFICCNSLVSLDA